MGEMDTKVSNTPILKLFGAKIPIEDKHSKEGEGREEEKVAAAEAEEKKSQKVLPCPRCKSMETKFCYFNNYNVNQPRHFCKGCQRYWTAGGALRNVPFGAGRRKAKPHCHVLAAAGGEFGQAEAGMEGVVLVEEWAAHVSAVASRAAKRRTGLSFGQFS